MAIDPQCQPSSASIMCAVGIVGDLNFMPVYEYPHGRKPCQLPIGFEERLDDQGRSMAHTCHVTTGQSDIDHGTGRLPAPALSLRTVARDATRAY